jgi:hypothetical protein
VNWPNARELAKRGFQGLLVHTYSLFSGEFRNLIPAYQPALTGMTESEEMLMMKA